MQLFELHNFLEGMGNKNHALMVKGTVDIRIYYVIPTRMSSKLKVKIQIMIYYV